jgi:SNF2 family DNA or RNA helicase
MEKSQFDFWITSPIKRKQPNSLTTLGDLVRATCLRRTKEIAQNSLKLPLRIERIEEITLHQKDQELYEYFREKTAKIAAGLAGQGEDAPKISGGKDANILTLINFLRRICNHGENLLPQSALEARRANIMLVDWKMMQNCNKSCDSCGSHIEELDFLSDDIPEFDCHHSICTICTSQSDNTSAAEMQKCPKCAAKRVKSENSSSLPKSSIRFSAKVEALMQNLHTEQTLEQHKNKALPVKRYPTTI